MIVVHRVYSLPEGVEELLAAADAEGMGHVARLCEDFASGTNRFDRSGEGLWEARNQAGLLGVCGLNQDPFAEPAERAGRIRRLFVLAAWRRHGVASRLLDAVEAKARRQHAMVAVFTTNPAAAAFYDARGYETVTGVPKRSFQLRL